MANVSQELRATGHRLCKEYLGGTWAQISLEEFGIDVMRGGLSNHLFLCTLPDSIETKEDEPRKVLLRIYGQILQECPETVLRDSLNFALLAEKHLGPKLYGAFTIGRIEEYMKESRCLQTAELHNPEISAEVAIKMAEMHHLRTMPTCKQPRWLSDTMTNYVKEIEEIKEDLDKVYPPGSTKRMYYDRIMSHDIIEEFTWLMGLIKDTPSPIVFCHNDLQEGNILLLPANSPDKPNIMPIDFEYAAYNYRGFDLGNHMCEWCYDYHVETYPYYKANLDDFPSRDQQLIFIRSYLDQCPWVKDRESEENHMLHEIAVHRLVSHFFWMLWSVVQGKWSDIKFGYLEYAEERLKGYLVHKQCLMDQYGATSAAYNGV